MPQIQKGTCTVTNDNAHNKVIGDASTDWTDAEVDDWFSLVLTPTPTGQIYQITSVTPPSSSSSGFWELTVNGNINETLIGAGVQVGLEYCVHIDFITVSVAGLTLYFPVFAPGDVQTSEILARFMATLATALGALQASATNLLHHSKLITGGDVGLDRIFMPYPVSLSAPASHLGNPVVIKAASGDDNIFVESVDSSADDGYYVNLSAPAEAGQTIMGSYIP